MAAGSKSNRNVVKVHTFADDLKRAQAAHGGPAEQAQTTPAPKAPPATPAPKSTPPPQPTPADVAIPPKPTPAPEPKPESTANEPTAPTDTANPPFHFIQSSNVESDLGTPLPQPPKPKQTITDLEVEPIGVGRVKGSILTDEDNIYDIKDEAQFGDGSIIKDTKRKRFRLIPAIITSIKNWFGEKQEQIAEARKPKSFVHDSHRREKTIKTAAKSSALAPRDDHDKIGDQLREADRTSKPADLQVATITKEAEQPRWTHTIEDEPVEKFEDTITDEASTETAEHEATTVARATAETETTEGVAKTDEAELPTTIPEEPTASEDDFKLTIPTSPAAPEESGYNTDFVVQQPPERPVYEPLPQERPMFAPPQTTPEEELATDKPAPTPATPATESKIRNIFVNDEPVETTPLRPQFATPTPTRTTTPAQVAPEPEPVDLDERPSTALPYRPAPDRSSSPNALLLIVVIITAIILGVGTSVWWFSRDTEPATSTETTIPDVVITNTQVPFPLPSSRTPLLETLTAEHQTAGSGVTQFYPTYPDINGLTAAAPTAEIIYVLNPRAEGGFLRSIETIGFGSLNGQAPFIILKTNSFDTALSGMLSWERTMSVDLAPFFGEPVDRSFEQGARSIDQTRDAAFTDTLIANRDVRVLFDEAKQERLLYSFVNRNTILITTNRAAFTELVPLVK